VCKFFNKESAPKLVDLMKREKEIKNVIASHKIAKCY